MLHYKLSKLARQHRVYTTGQVVRLPGIHERAGAVAQYRAELRKLLREMAKGVREDVLPAYAEYRRTQRSNRITVDAQIFDGRSWFANLRDTMRSLETTASRLVGRIFDLEGRRHTKTWKRDVRRTLGVNLESVVDEEDLREALEDAVSKNVSLISSLSKDTLRKIEARVLGAKLRGASVNSLRKELLHEFGLAANRADLIAQDQMNKVTADLNRFRHEQAGISSYDWSTSHDERVRKRHRKLDGTRYKYKEATGAEQGLPPGKPIRCRCVALAVVEF